LQIVPEKVEFDSLSFINLIIVINLLTPYYIVDSLLKISEHLVTILNVVRIYVEVHHLLAYLF
jgi:hypothetical protein